MTEAEKAYQYFVIAVPENEEQAKAYFWAMKALQPTLTQPNEAEHAGLHEKYTVYKNKDGSLVTDCFILRPAKDPAAVAALRAYAATTDNAELADDIINWVGAEPNKPLELEELRDMNVDQWVWLEFPGCSADEDYWERALKAFHMYSHEDYGKTWIAYRHRPKGEGR